MPNEHTTAAVQRYLNALAEEPAHQGQGIVHDLVGRAVQRLRLLCGSFLHHRYPRLTRPPFQLRTDELLSSVAERLLKALSQVRPQTVRQFFALASQHVRWELNDLARRLDAQPDTVGLPDGLALPTARSDSCLTPTGRRILEAIDQLPEEDREVFNLVRLQGLTHAEVADVLGVATRTVKRRLDRALLLLAEHLHDLSPP